MKVLFVGESHRRTEFNSMIDALNGFEKWNSTMIIVEEWITIEDVFDAIESVEAADLIVVSENGPGTIGDATKSPIVMVHKSVAPFLLVPSARDILNNKVPELHDVTKFIVAEGAKYHKTIVMIPGRDNEMEKPTYMAPKCWFDNVNPEEIWFYR